MNPAYLSPLANHLWQSTLFAAIAGLLTLLLRKNRARVRHWVWLAASWKFLVPFSMLISVGSHVHWRTAPQAMQSNLSVVIDQVSQPFTVPAALSVPMTAAPPAASAVPALLWTIWACGFLGISCSWWVRWRRIRAAVRAGSSMQLEIPIGAICSPTLLEPGIFGVFRPVLLLPQGIVERLTAAQLKGIVAHELCHVRHRDNLIAAIHMFVETAFWFHPLVWWIGNRMVEERERACDEEVLRLGNEPQVYAEAILNVCKTYVESPLFCVAGVTGSDLKKRIQSILKGRVADDLNFVKKVALVFVGAAALAVPISVGMMSPRPLQALAQPSARSGTASAPKFEVASIKPCRTDIPPGGRSGNSVGETSPGRLNLNCQTVKGLIEMAYIYFARGHLNPASSIPMSGGPSWINSERYSINAKAEGTQTQGMMRGPMMQALLEDRFDLKIRRETREVPIYALTVAKAGPKLKQFKEGSCIPFDFAKFPPEPPEPGENYCHSRSAKQGANVTVEAQATRLDEFCRFFLSRLDRPVIDRTGITGRFDFHLVYAPDESPSRFPGDGSDAGGAPGAMPSDDPPGQSIFTALQQQLGLKLDKTTGPGEFLVIDHVKRPRENQ